MHDYKITATNTQEKYKTKQTKERKEGKRKITTSAITRLVPIDTNKGHFLKTEVYIFC